MGDIILPAQDTTRLRWCVSLLGMWDATLAEDELDSVAIEIFYSCVEAAAVVISIAGSTTRSTSSAQSASVAIPNL